MNSITLTGHLGSKPTIETSKGVTFARLSLATRHVFKDADGERDERTDWHRIVAFNGLAESLATLKKGDRIGVRGRLQTQTYEKDGDRRTSFEIVAAEIEFLFSRARKAADTDTPDDEPEAEEPEDLTEVE